MIGAGGNRAGIDDAPVTDIRRRLLDPRSSEPFVPCGVVVADELVARLRADALAAVDSDARYHGTTDYPEYGRVLECAHRGGAFHEFLDHEVFALADAVLGEPAIVYTMVASCVPPGPGRSAGASSPHRDLHHFSEHSLSGFALMVPLDDFTADAGATRYLPGSGVEVTAPAPDRWAAESVPLLAPAGSTFFFSGVHWHGASRNLTADWRCFLIVGLVAAWRKQRFDLPRMVPEDLAAAAGPGVRRRLGFDSRPPASYDEYFRNGATGRPT